MTENPLSQVTPSWQRLAVPAKIAQRLVRKGLIEQRRPKSQMFRLTEEGSKAKAELQTSAQPQPEYGNRFRSWDKPTRSTISSRM